jgi:hypothetical protein
MHDLSDTTLRVAVIGPTAIAVTAAAAGLDASLCERAAEDAGAGLALRGYTVVLVPDRGVGELAARAYRTAGGPRLLGIIPHGGTAAQNDSSHCESHRHLCHETIEDLTWTGQHERLCQLCDVLLCIGLSCGTIAEIAWTKWVGNRPVFVLRPLVSGIPPEIEAETDLRWFDDLNSAFRHLDALAAQRAGTTADLTSEALPGSR